VLGRRHPVMRLARPFLLLLLLALAAPASAQAVWSAPLTLSAAGQIASEPQVAVDQSGDAFFVWSRYDATTDCGGNFCLRVQARARSAAGALSATQTLSAPGQDAHYPQVGVDQSGNAVFVWERPDATTDCRGSTCDRVQTRARSAAGTLSALQTLSPAGQDTKSAQVAVDPSGNAVFVWQGLDATACGACFRIQARARSASGVLSTTQILSGSAATAPGVGVDQSGNAVFVWQGFDGTTDCSSFGCYRVQARTRSAAGVLGATENISPAGKNANSPQVAVEQSGNAVFAWLRPDGTTDCAGAACNRVQTRTRSAAGVLSATQTLSPPGQDAVEPQVGVDQSGNAVFVWLLSDGTTNCGGLACHRVQARARSAAGVLSAVQTLSDPGRDAGYSQVAVDQTGNAVFVWARPDATMDCGGLGCDRVQARTRSAAGVLGATVTLSAPGQRAFQAQVAVDPGGAAAAVWVRFDGAYDRIQAATGP
jgi:uncharacterized protein YheU (UPF0270 family)